MFPNWLEIPSPNSRGNWSDQVERDKKVSCQSSRENRLPRANIFFFRKPSSFQQKFSLSESKKESKKVNVTEPKFGNLISLTFKFSLITIPEIISNTYWVTRIILGKVLGRKIWFLAEKNKTKSLLLTAEDECSYYTKMNKSSQG